MARNNIPDQGTLLETKEAIMTPKYLQPGAGESIQLLGEPRIFKVTPAENGGSYLQFEAVHAPGAVVPPHFHYEEDEAFYVLAGQFEFILGETRFTATAGAYAFAPRHTVHAFTNTGQEEGRILITVTPGAQHEGFMREMGELTRRLGKQPEMAEVIPIALKYGWGLPSATS
jgi:quercetin dioxygenase-like cupin family protein